MQMKNLPQYALIGVLGFAAPIAGAAENPPDAPTVVAAIEGAFGVTPGERVEVEPPPRARQHFQLGHREHARHPQQRLAQRRQVVGAECRRLYIDVWRFDLDRRHVERAAGERGEDFLGDADPVGEVDVDAHGLYRF